MKKVLVTGASGFIGRALLESLKDDKFLVTPFSYTKFLSSAEELMPSHDCLIHLAAIVHKMGPQHKADELAYAQVNVEGVKRLAIAAHASGCTRFIFISSVKAVGESTRPGEAFHADSNCLPQDLYGRSKLAAEKALFEVSARTGLEIVVLRLPLVYGPHVKGNLLTLLKAIRLGVPMPLGAATNKRSLLSLENLVSLIKVSLTHPSAKNEIFLVSDDDDISTVQLIRALGSAISQPVKLFYAPRFLLKAIASLAFKKDIYDRLFGNLQLDIQKTKQLLGWMPPLKFNDALKRIDFSRD
jgi:nucleoside-diphosphate-sugar epimerase